MPGHRRLRRAIPGPLREKLYDWSPSRRRRWRQIPGLERVPASAGAALTFDDGPDARWTGRLLDALDRAGATATFFLVGEQLPGNEALSREIEARGHEVGLHGMTHRRHDALDAGEARAELTRGIEAVEAVTGRRPAWYRPPYGAASPQIASACGELGLKLAYWSSWGQDWEEKPARDIARLVERDLEPGAVILLHDSARYGQRADAGPTIEAIPQIARAADAIGIGLVSLGIAANAGTV
jgi:peptidoglycan/xylan/chitin deacetylase (PgdA/CDA1 family)